MEAEKELVKDHWERETCGTRYGQGDRQEYFREITRTRYELEPAIMSFANFPQATGKHVLEIGVGAGSDFENWCEHAAHATGVDLTEKAIELTNERLTLKGVAKDRYSLHQVDAEQLPFGDNSFDIVYSFGVLHHTPNPPKAFSEACRVLKPGGQFIGMVYQVPSISGFLLYVRYGLLRGKIGASQKEIVFKYLESPGTHSYSKKEGSELLATAGFPESTITTALNPGDLLTLKLSDRYSSPIYRMIQVLYPRWLIKTLWKDKGLELLLKATKPQDSNRSQPAAREEATPAATRV
jgi:ubiquinone/menaquinone biosynthesis C-methylase UbiE